LRPERQFGQVGAELIGVVSPAADAEVILMAVEALNAVGVRDLSVDLCMPTLVPAVCRDRKIPDRAIRRLRVALDRKDAAGVAALESELGKASTKILSGLLAAAGVAEETLKALKKLRLPKSAAEEEARLAAAIKAIKHVAPALTLTVDPVENRGFEYHTGVTFTLFAKGVRGELGSGGRYRAGNASARGEAATGLTLFMDTVLRAIAPAPSNPRVFLPYGTPATIAATLRADGWVTLAELKRSAKPEIEARTMRCTHILKGNKPVELSDRKTAGKRKK
jgi:ATP phosphoribosyltransferase regulatory subunit